MKKLHLTLLAFIGISLSLSSQNAPITFEAGGFGADWTWAVFENDTNPPLEIIANPDPSGANTSATVAQFTALATGNPWAGTESALATDLGIYTLSEENSIVKIMVWKTNISNVGIKMVTTSLGALPELLVPNTLTNQWEEITFDFSGYIDNAIYAIEDVAQIVVFPDFMDRNEDHVSYFDNITIGDGSSTSDPCPSPAAVICDNFDDYDLGPVDVQAAHWGPWSAGGTVSNVSDEQAFSNDKSLKIDVGGVEDNLLLLNDEVTGVWTVEWMTYVPAGATGFFNIQADPVAGEAFIYQAFLNQGGGAAGTGSFQQLPETFTYPEDEWFPIIILVDLNNAVHSLTVNGTLVLDEAPYIFNAGTGPSGDHTLSAINFYSIDASNTVYIDDVVYDGDATVGLIEYTESTFTVYPNPTEDMLTIAGDAQIDAVVVRDVLGAVVRQLDTPFSNQVTIDVADLTEGIYFVEVRVGDVVNVSRVIKK
jgi:hypothetical protein